MLSIFFIIFINEAVECFVCCRHCDTEHSCLSVVFNNFK